MKRDFSKNTLSVFLTYYRPHWRLLAIDMICVLLSSLADLAFPLAFCPPYPIPFPTSRGRKGEPCAGRGASLHPARSLNGFLIYVSGQLARNFWDPGKASIVFASNSSRSGTGRAVQFGGSRDKTWDHFTKSLLGFLQD